MGFLATSVTAIETIRLNGLTVTRQLVDAPTKAFWLLIFAIHPTTKVRGLSCFSYCKTLNYVCYHYTNLPIAKGVLGSHILLKRHRH